MSLSITKQFEFEASHHLPKHQGKCAMLHGHSYKLEIEVGGTIGKDGMIADFSEVKKVVQNYIIAALDHSHLNDIMEHPTAENTIVWILGILKGKMNIIRIRLWETSSSYAEWRAG